MYSKKYIIEKIEEFGRHNSLYDVIEEGKSICYPVYFNVGERGWFLYEGDDWFRTPHRVHTSVVKEVKYSKCFVPTQIIVTTQNTRFTFTEINAHSGDV